ncbi:MAG: DUF2184 domain-containing protein [Vallitaleaceae bacterium]|nr:DUF2184 domain-containing protein [Vallitaleaceae bacterium]
MKDILGNRVERKDEMLLQRDLETIDDVLYEPKEEELIVRTFLDIYDGIPEHAEVYKYDRYERQGGAKRSATGADDVPYVDNDKTRVQQNVISIENAFKIEKQELRAARANGRNVDTEKAETARRYTAENENDLVFLGDDNLGIEGLVNADGINTYDVPNDSDADGTEWEYKTGQEIITDIREARAKVNKEDGYMADTLVLPPTQYEALAKPYNDYNSETIMTYLMQQGWFDRILEISYLEGADPDGDNDVGLVLDTTPSNMQLGLAIDMQRDEPYRLPNGAYQVRTEERTTGAIIRRPKAICRFDLI